MAFVATVATTAVRLQPNAANSQQPHLRKRKAQTLRTVGKLESSRVKLSARQNLHWYETYALPWRDAKLEYVQPQED
jgi:hypothetical protein